MGRLGLGLPRMASGQLDLFSTPDPVPEVPKVKLETVEPELSKNPGELPREHVSKPYKLEPPPVAPVTTKISIQTIAYTVLVMVELALTGLAMWSIGHSLPVQIGMVIIGTAATLLRIGRRDRGPVVVSGVICADRVFHGTCCAPA